MRIEKHVAAVRIESRSMHIEPAFQTVQKADGLLGVLLLLGGLLELKKLVK